MAETYVAVTQEIERAGTIVMWTMRGETQLVSLYNTWKAAGLDVGLLPYQPTAATALRRAVAELRESGRIVHPIGRGAGFAVVKVKTDSSEELEFTEVARAKLNKVEQLVTSGDPKLCKVIADLFAHHGNSLEPVDVSTWLIDIIQKQLDGVGMKASGGVYFVPHAQLAKLDLIIGALRAAAPMHTVYKIPCMKGEDAVQAILDSIAAETDAALSTMTAELEEGTLGEQAWRNRAAKCGVLESKVARYEALLGEKLDAVRERLESVRAELTVAVVQTDIQGVANGQESCLV